MSIDRVRVLTLNQWGRGGVWTERRDALRRGLAELAPDLVALQEAVKDDDADTVAELFAPDFHVWHQTTGLLGDGNCAAIASRWPLRTVRELDQQVTPRTAKFPATTLIAEIAVPDPVGPLLFVNHLPSWEPALELERELQTVGAARVVEAIVAATPMHVVLAGDLDAVPDAASIRFLRGLQSLEGLSVWYRDAWSSLHTDEPGHTFALRNPLMSDESDMRMEVSRRIDYVFVRCDSNGPTLEIADCRLAFDEPIDGAWASDHFGVIADLAAPSTTRRASG
jgi:endonuclease/exonuclease/phosphatase family metal-dependent hydrolase